MKTFIIKGVTLFLFSISIFAQETNYYIFNELTGFEDNNNNTQLFYRLFTSGYTSMGYYYSNSIYRLEPNSGYDQLFLHDGGWGGLYNSVDDYEFWENNYNRYIYAGTSGYTEGVPVVYRYDQQEPIFDPQIWGSSYNLELSRQDTNIIFLSLNTGWNYKSIDWGNNWDSLTFNDEILSVSPFDHNIIFTSNQLNLLKSNDGGDSFSLVDTGKIFIKDFYYDIDGNHIYAIDRRYGTHLVVSDNIGEPFSWETKYSSDNFISISPDHSQSGNIYLADGKFIYHSSNYGDTFELFKELNKRIIGIYKKPDSEVLYAATKYKLWEITPDTNLIIKELELDPALAEFYPLEIGNKWIYEHKVCYDEYPPVPCDNYIDVIEITGDTLLSNGLNYYIVKIDEPYDIKTYYERYEQSDATVRRFSEDSIFTNNEYIIEDFLMEEGDTLCTNRFYYSPNCNIPKLYLGEITANLFNEQNPKKIYQVEDLNWHKYSLVKGFGIDSISYGFDFGYGTMDLKGCIINGEIYGDTTTVGIHNERETIPDRFVLYQNYPNPFNPTTTIKFNLPSPYQGEGPGVRSNWVTLKVYDILGREVATLVNEIKQPGVYEVEFDGSNLASGIYYYQLKAGSFSETKKLIILK